MRNFTYLLCFIIFPISLLKATPGTFNLDKNEAISFLQNKGQWHDDILFQGKSGNTNVYLLKNGLSFSQVDASKPLDERSVLVWNMNFSNISKQAVVTGVDGHESRRNYLRGGDASKWIIRPQEYKSVSYREIYKNIDLNFYGSGSSLKYDYVVKPGGKIGSISASYTGISRMTINDKGDLEIYTPWSVQVQKAPVSWQIIQGEKQPVDVAYVLLNDSTFGFSVRGSFDSRYDLVIDPLFEMVWASYTKATGASNNINYCFGSAMDKDGNVYLTGMVDSTFPITPGAYSGPGNVQPEVFVAKFSADGTTLLYSTYLPANSSEHGIAIAVDDLGRAYVTGVVDLNITGITDFPSTPNAYQPVHDQGSDAFLTVLDPTGSSLVYSTFLGDTGGEGGMGVVLGSTGIAYVVGTTSGGNFPVVNSTSYPTGNNNAFVAKFDIGQSGAASLLYSIKIGAGGSNSVFGRGIAVNAAGNVFITGTVFNSFGALNFPATPGAYNNVYTPGFDNSMSYVLKLSATTPISIDYATLLGPGEGNAVAVQPNSDEAIVTGATRTFTFPVTPGVMQPVHGQDALGNPNGDVVLLKINSTGTGLIYSTFLGGIQSEGGSGVAVNSAGEAYVVGIALDSFPTSPGCIQPNNAGSFDFFVAHVNATATAYACGGSTYVGGSDADYTGSFYDYPSPRVSLRDHGGNNDTILVSSTSHSQDFPTTPGVYGETKVNSIADQPVFFKLTCSFSGAPPVASFTQSINQSCNSVSIDFEDNSSGTPSSWQWTFTGGTPSTSTDENPQDIIYTVSGSYNVQLVSCNAFGCDSITQVIQVFVPQDIPVNLGNDTLICDGATVSLNANPGLNNYTWEFNGNPIGVNQPTLSVTQSGIYNVFVTDSLGCTGADTINISISDPQVSVGNDILLCNNDSVLINATAGFTTYQWSLNNAILPITGSSLYASLPGSYVVKVEDSVGCAAFDTLIVVASTVNLVLMNDSSFCDGDSVVINGGGGFASYSWELNGNIISTNPSITVSQSGNYSLTVTNNDGCEASDNVQIIVNSNPVITTIENIAICEGDSVTLTTSGAVSYTWSPSTWLSSPIGSNPVSVPADDISYTVTGVDANGCTGSDVVNIVVSEQPEAAFDFTSSFACTGIVVATQNKSTLASNYLWLFSDGTTSSEVSPVHSYNQLQNQTIQLIAINAGCADTSAKENIIVNIPSFDKIPNVLTPNNDGKNDCFEIAGISVFNDCYSLQIFSRWGKEVFSTKNPGNCFNGKDNDGNELPGGVYYYLVKIRDLEKEGAVHLLK